eukprot:7536792-Karenia_brevis.AAC.1
MVKNSLSTTIGDHSPKEGVISHYRARMKCLERDESGLHDSVNQSVREVIRGKNILIFKEMLRDRLSRYGGGRSLGYGHQV